MKPRNPSLTVLESLNLALKQAMVDDDRVVLLGEDILDPYGGAFKVTRSLSETFPDRVIGTPISEAGIVGLATGLALRGLRPVVEIMFGDFTTLVVDQVLNHLSKFCSMFKDVQMQPVVIRTPMGGRRGYGPTHSQSIERLFLGIPSLNVLAPCHFSGGAGELLYSAIVSQDEPVFFVENKLQYLLPIQEQETSSELDISQVGGAGDYPVFRVSVRGAPEADLTIITYGYPTELARQAMVDLAYQRELFINLLVFTRLSPLILPISAEQILKQHDILILEEGTRSWGWGSELAARLGEQYPHRKGRLLRLAARDSVIPASPTLESKVLPQMNDVIQTILAMRGVE